MTAPVRTLLLAGSFSEAAKYAKGNGLKQYRYAVNAHSVANFRPDDVVELPGYESRRDKHAFKSIIRLAAARGVHVRKDEYIPPPPPPEPQYGEEGYVADLTFGDIAASIQAVVQDVVEAVVGVQDLKQDDFVESAPQDRVNGPKKAEPVQNNVSGSQKKRGPKATKTPIPAPPKTVTSTVDDLFED